VVRYTFTVMDLHHLLLAGLPAHYINFRFVRCPLVRKRDEFRDQPTVIDRHRTSHTKQDKLQDSLKIARWRTPCARWRLAVATRPTSVTRRLDHASQQSSPSSKPAADSRSRPVSTLAAVLPGLANLSIQRLPELTPTAWAASNLQLSMWFCLTDTVQYSLRIRNLRVMYSKPSPSPV
jgi:hypothetical protein